MKNFNKGFLLNFWWVPLSFISVFYLGSTYSQNKAITKLQRKMVEKSQRIKLKRSIDILEKEVFLSFSLPEKITFCSHGFKNSFVLFFDKSNYFFGQIPGHRETGLVKTADKYIFEKGQVAKAKSLIILESEKGIFKLRKELRVFRVSKTSKKPLHLSYYGEVFSRGTCRPSENKWVEDYLKHFAYKS